MCDVGVVVSCGVGVVGGGEELRVERVVAGVGESRRRARKGWNWWCEWEIDVDEDVRL